MKYRLTIVFLMSSIIGTTALPMQAQTESGQWDEVGRNLASTGHNLCKIADDLCQSSRTVALWVTWASSGLTGFVAHHPKKIIVTAVGSVAWYYWKKYQNNKVAGAIDEAKSFLGKNFDVASAGKQVLEARKLRVGNLQQSIAPYICMPTNKQSNCWQMAYAYARNLLRPHPAEAITLEGKLKTHQTQLDNKINGLDENKDNGGSS